MTLFTVKWTNFKVLKKHDIDRDKPYLWVWGIVVDSTSIESGNYVIRKPSTSNNLGQKFKKGDSVSVPSNLDISREVAPIFGKATAGVVVVAWESAMTKDSVIADAYDIAADTINEFVTESVEKALEEILEALAAGESIDDLEFGLSDAEMTALRTDVDAKVRATIKDGWSVFQLVHDHNIGQAQTVLSLKEPFVQYLDYRFTCGSTDYSLEADLKYGVLPPSTGPEPDLDDIPVKDQEPKPQSTK